MIIGISGKIQSGKDTVGEIIQYLTDRPNMSYSSWLLLTKETHVSRSNWKVVKFADKLKECASLILNIPREDLEKIEVKNSNLPEEWNYARVISNNGFSQPGKFASQREASDYARDLRNAIAGSDYMGQSFNMTVRDFLQQFGTNTCRDKVHPNFWVNALFSEYKLVSFQHAVIDHSNPNHNIMMVGEPFVTEYPNWIITDVRFPNELEAVKSREGITIRVNRDSAPVGKNLKLVDSSFVNEHSSETALDNITFSYTINNNGTIEELIIKVKEILIKEKIIL